MKRCKVLCCIFLLDILGADPAKNVAIYFIEWFSVECRKTKTKVISLANHKEHTQFSEPIKTRNKYR